MNERIATELAYQLHPQLAKSLIALGTPTASSGIVAPLTNLIKLRASQINGCAFCQHMHANEARLNGESQTRLDLLNIWREISIFNSRERAALGWTEALTQIASKGVPEAEFNKVAAEFNAEEIVNLTSLIVAINSWNRIAVGFGLLPKY